MSKKDVDNYFKEICKDYHDLVETLHEVEDYATKNIVSSEKLEEIKLLVEQSKNNYLRISYIMFLLDKPTRKKKYEHYNNTHKYDLSQDLTTVKTEDKEIIQQIKRKLV